MTYVVIMAAFGVLTSLIAQRKGESASRWFVWGILLGPVAMLVALITAGQPCPMCMSKIHRLAVRCPRCQATLVSPPPERRLKDTEAATLLPPIDESRKTRL